MEELELRSLWKAYEQKLETSLSLNYENMKEIQKMKARSALRPVKAIKWVAVCLGFLWILFLGYLIVNSFAWKNIFFTSSISILFIIYSIAVIIYIRHLVLINQFDESATVVEAQEKLAALQTSFLQAVRLLFLTMPLYCTWYITADWIKNAPLTFWLIQIPIILFFSFLGIWLYRNINYKNSQKRWFKILFSSAEWTGVLKAREFMDRIREFKSEA